MNNNSNTNIQESKICGKCMTFYANPDKNNFCSGCYKKIDSESSVEDVPLSFAISSPSSLLVPTTSALDNDLKTEEEVQVVKDIVKAIEEDVLPVFEQECAILDHL